MPPQYADFSKEEFEPRYSKTRALMVEKNLDAMLITERLNYHYYTGHRSEKCAVDKIRSYLFVLPKDGEPTLITMPFEIAQVEQTSFCFRHSNDRRPHGASGVHYRSAERSLLVEGPHRR